jgi:hypothetical protein
MPIRVFKRSGTRFARITGSAPSRQRQGFSLREDRFETPLKYLRRGLAVDDEEIVILPLQSRRGKIRGTRA